MMSVKKQIYRGPSLEGREDFLEEARIGSLPESGVWWNKGMKSFVLG